MMRRTTTPESSETASNISHAVDGAIGRSRHSDIIAMRFWTSRSAACAIKDEREYSGTSTLSRIADEDIER